VAAGEVVVAVGFPGLDSNRRCASRLDFDVVGEVDLRISDVAGAGLTRHWRVVEWLQALWTEGAELGYVFGLLGVYCKAILDVVFFLITLAVHVEGGRYGCSEEHGVRWCAGIPKPVKSTSTSGVAVCSLRAYLTALGPRGQEHRYGRTLLRGGQGHEGLLPGRLCDSSGGQIDIFAYIRAR
jgi:hypothetical protein